MIPDGSIVRKNLILLAVVESGISMSDESGWIGAASFMSACRVPKEVIIRVLFQPQKRRKEGIFHMEWIQYY